jgi:hypothetical protein
MCLLHGTFCPYSVFVCVVWIWEQTAIISLYSINWLVFITETECVYCAVRAASLNIIQVNCEFNGIIVQCQARKGVVMSAQVTADPVVICVMLCAVLLVYRGAQLTWLETGSSVLNLCVIDYWLSLLLFNLREYIESCSMPSLPTGFKTPPQDQALGLCFIPFCFVAQKETLNIW